MAKGKAKEGAGVSGAEQARSAEVTPKKGGPAEGFAETDFSARGEAGQDTFESKTLDFGKDEEIEKLKAMVESLKNELRKSGPQIVQISAESEKVIMRWQAEVADDNIEVFGPNGRYGQVTGKTGTVIVPKHEWSIFYNDVIRRRIASRWLIVLSGLDDQEREIYGCAYKEGELLDEKAFSKLLDMGHELIDIFPKLCDAHQEMISRRFIDAWDKGDSRVKDRALVVALNEISKSSYKKSDGKGVAKGLFYPIIEGLNMEDAGE